jgi:hypothetical protein
MPVSLLLDAAGRRRSPVTLPGYLAGRPPRNKGIRYPADPPPAEEIVAVMRQAGTGVHGARVRGLPHTHAGRPALFASSTVSPADGPGQPTRLARSCADSRPKPACGGASRRTSCVTRTRSNSLTRVCRSTSSNASSATPTSASVDLPARDRQRRDHRHRPRPPRADDHSKLSGTGDRAASTSWRIIPTWIAPGPHSSATPPRTTLSRSALATHSASKGICAACAAK